MERLSFAKRRPLLRGITESALGMFDVVMFLEGCTTSNRKETQRSRYIDCVSVCIVAV